MRLFQTILSPRSVQLRQRLVLLIIVLLLAGCSQTRKRVVGARQWLTWHPALRDSLFRNVQFEFEVQPEVDGRYQLSGMTELPDGSRLAIAAVRYLKLDPKTIVETAPGFDDFDNFDDLEDSEGSEDADSSALAPALSPERDNQQLSLAATSKRLALNPTYAILDYEQAEVQAGTWQVQLNLWQVARDGRYQESWQLDQEELQLQWEPEPDVIFLATLIVDGAADRLQPVQDELAERQLSLSSTLIQTSPEGEQFFQAAQVQPIDLPQGKTAPPGLRVQDINGGWGERYLLVEQDPLPGTLKFPINRNSNAPGSPAEFIH